MPKIWDTFMLRDELDMLECRLVELDDSPVWRHVLVESSVDHRGRPKPLWYAENKDRFAPWKDRIVHVVADLSSIVEDKHAAWETKRQLAWLREHKQRDAASYLLDNPEDRVLAADLDEIPSSVMFGVEDTRTLYMKILGFAVDWLAPHTGPTSVIGRVGDISSLSAARDNRKNYCRLDDAGWHISWLGGEDAIRDKAESTCHLELYDTIKRMNEDKKFYHEGLNWWEPEHLIPVKVDKTWPKYIYERRCPQSWFRPRSENVAA